VNAYVSGRFRAKIPIKWKLASEADMKRLFDEWPDSREEYVRHYEVYFQWGFERCFLIFNSGTGEVVNFRFLLMNEDLPKIREHLPLKAYRDLTSKSCAHHNWSYTFEKWRRLGIQTHSMDFVIEFCRGNGIKWLYSQRGYGNTPSIRYADKVGFIPIAVIYHVQFLGQKKHSGLYIVKKIHRQSGIFR